METLMDFYAQSLGLRRRWHPCHCSSAWDAPSKQRKINHKKNVFIKKKHDFRSPFWGPLKGSLFSRWDAR